MVSFIIFSVLILEVRAVLLRLILGCLNSGQVGGFDSADLEPK